MGKASKTRKTLAVFAAAAVAALVTGAGAASATAVAAPGTSAPNVTAVEYAAGVEHVSPDASMVEYAL